MSTVKVKPWGEGQGDFVIIDEADYLPDIHQLYAPPGEAAPAGPAPSLSAADLGGDGQDPPPKPAAKRPRAGH